MQRWLLLLLLVFAVVFAGCARPADDDPAKSKESVGLGPQKFQDEYTSFHTGSLPIGWERHWGYNADLAFHNPIHRTTIVVNSTCRQKDYIPLEALRNHLLFDLTDRRIVSQEEVIVDLRSALHTVVQGRMDGALVKLDLFVVQIDTCIYDLVYISTLEQYASCKDDFYRFVEGFHVRRKE